ncbi:MAG: hypothetical protein IH899_03075, partial [Planctomycetes bacterium]|nr:hypothetical protein [Planctomycetota bacterium]
MNNVDPTITLLTVPLDPVDINDQLSFSVDVTFTDPAGILDQPYTCNFDMDDDGVDDITVTDVMGTSCSTPLNYSEPGVYIVT